MEARSSHREQKWARLPRAGHAQSPYIGLRPDSLRVPDRDARVDRLFDRRVTGRLSTCVAENTLRDWMTRAVRIDVAAAGLAVVVLVSALAQTPSDPWSAGDLLAPEALAKTLRDGKPPMILYVGFPALYKSSHIPGAILAGPDSKPEGIEALKAALAGVPRDNEIVLYCGC